MTKLNLAQRIIVVIGLAGALAFFGEWVSTLHGYNYGFVSGIHIVRGHDVPSAPQPTETGLHPWAVMLVWVALTVLWTVASTWMFRIKPDRPEAE